jgi:benzoyl-CoA reductase/2-hydroxyglutaryl-CoA dehydratase subunit BcrC/BadD/HgdB
VNTSNRSKASERFTEAAGSLANPAVRGWKDGGGKVVGYFCSSVPEEIISAAGLLPVRIRATGSTETDLLGQSQGDEHGGARLMLEGSMLDDPAYVKVIEDQGGLVVTDALCFGSRIMWKDVDEAVADPLEALARYHLGGKPSCARMIGEHPQRLDYIGPSSGTASQKASSAISRALRSPLMMPSMLL